ncbi:BLUF domain-containing protein [Psychrobacter sp. B38]|uniref:BLUF domain-containing protein n=1 Tax=Psychrobacter sp. B38 TaxID=3143538 RepID=UPI00320CE037
MQATTDFEPEVKNRSGEHILISLTYIAKKTEANSGMALTRALEHWRRYFEETGITSALVFNENYFIQNVQGSRPAINDALAKIIGEYLEVLPHVIDVEEIETRRWDGFLIKYLTSSAEDELHALKSFSAGSDFNPYLMKTTQIASFLKSIFGEKEFHINNVI